MLDVLGCVKIVYVFEKHVLHGWCASRCVKIASLAIKSAPFVQLLMYHATTL